MRRFANKSWPGGLFTAKQCNMGCLIPFTSIPSLHLHFKTIVSVPVILTIFSTSFFSVEFSIFKFPAIEMEKKFHQKFIPIFYKLPAQTYFKSTFINASCNKNYFKSRRFKKCKTIEERFYVNIYKTSGDTITVIRVFINSTEKYLVAHW